MSSSSSRMSTGLLLGVVLVALVALAANTALRPSAPAPSTPPVTSPSTPPSPEPTTPPSEEPSEQPSQPPADGPTKIALENLTGHDVWIEVDDETGGVVDAMSGTPGDGMSVRWFDVKVENIDADTLRVVWVGLPRNEIVRLGVSTVDSKLRLRFVQDGPPPYSDAVGFDRILELSFAQPVRSEDVLTSIQESLDTQD